VTLLPSRRHALDATLSYTQMIRQAGMTPGFRLLSALVRPAEPDEAADLAVDDDTPVRVLERLRTADERPVVYSVDVIVAQRVAGLRDADLDAGLYDVLASVGSRVRTASAVLLPVVADAKLARLLDVRRGAALQRIDEVDRTDDGSPVMRSTEWHVPGIFELRVNRRS
jgi:GntR family transcriptional regulator